jgi:hypothetical protein
MESGSASTGIRKREKRPHIDYDAKIAEASAVIKNMTRAVAAAKSAQRNERRKKQRLLKKAACLSPEDLERIAVLKRCGLWTGQPPEVCDRMGEITTAGNDLTTAKETSATSASCVPDSKSTSDAFVSHPDKNPEADAEEQSDEDMPGKD